MKETFTILGGSEELGEYINEFSTNDRIKTVLLQIVGVLQTQPQFIIEEYLMWAQQCVGENTSLSSYAKSINQNAKPDMAVDFNNRMNATAHVIGKSLVATKLGKALIGFNKGASLPETLKDNLTVTEDDVVSFMTAVTTNMPIADKNKIGVNNVLIRTIGGMLTCFQQLTDGKEGLITGVAKDKEIFVYLLDIDDAVQARLDVFFENIQTK